MSWELVVKDKFAAAHYLDNYKGKCEKMHGHTFQVEAWFRVTDLDEAGIGIDFTELKAYLKEILPDHKVLNEVYDFNPSAENLSRHLYYQIKETYPSVSRIMVWESENAGAVYSED
jgi:6-pyruvoyltetrahydropterin/6-carboxytetrahydropterin synthase